MNTSTSGYAFKVGETAIFPGCVRSEITRVHEAYGSVLVTDADGFAWKEGDVSPLPEGATERIEAADIDLTAAYDALKSHPKMPKAATDQLAWQSLMLSLFAGVTDALGELLDAKLDAKTINPTRAARIRSEAATLQATAERNVQLALRKALRMARSH